MPRKKFEMMHSLRRLWDWLFPAFDRDAHERECEELARQIERSHQDW